MPRKLVKTFKSWSFSRLNDWEQCPFRAKSKHLDKVKEPEGPALERGRRIEDENYAYIFGGKKVTKLPESGVRFDVELAALKKIAKGVLNNREIAFTKDWKPCAWDAWDVAWVRIKMDLLWASSLKNPYALPKNQKDTAIRVADLKTGKIYEDKLDQLDLYKLAALLIESGLLPPSDIAVSQMWYLDQGETRPDGSWSSLFRSDIEHEIKRWNKRVTPMLLDTAFLPKPGHHCLYCPLAKRKGGTCPY